MPNQYDLTNEYVSSTYGRVLQIVSSSLYDGFGNSVFIHSGSSLHIREEVTVTQQTSSYNYSLLQGAQSGSSVEIYYNGQLLNLTSYSNVGPLYTLDSNLEVYAGDVLTFIYYVNNTSGSGGGSSTSSSYSDYAATASYLLGSISSASYSTYAETASYVVSSSYSNNSDQSISSSYAPAQPTSSYSMMALSASWAPGGGSSISSSYSNNSSTSDNSISSSHSIISDTASYFNGNIVTSSYSVSSSYSNIALSASYAPTPDTASYSINSLSSSWAPVQISSSYSLSSSYAPSQPTSSYAINSLTASYAKTVDVQSTASYSISSSQADYANTASYYNGSVVSSSHSTTSSYSAFNPYIVTIGSRISTEDTYITAGSKGYKHIGYPCTIVKARTISGGTGSIDINIKRNGSLLGNINITSNTGSYDTALSGWTTQLNTDDLIEFYVSGSSVYITDVTIFIDIKAR